MSLPPITSNPLALAKFNDHLTAGRFLEALQHVRGRFAVTTADLPFPHWETHQRLERENPRRAEYYAASGYRARIEAERRAYAAFSDLEKGGSGLHHEELVQQLRDGTAPGWSPLARLQRLRELGEHEAARHVMDHHGREIASAEIAASAEAAKKSAAEGRVRQARSDRLGPQLKQVALDATNAFRNRIRQLEIEHGIHGDAKHTSAFREACEAARAEMNRATDKRSIEVAAAVEAELVAEGIVAPAQPEPPRAA